MIILYYNFPIKPVLLIVSLWTKTQNIHIYTSAYDIHIHKNTLIRIYYMYIYINIIFLRVDVLRQIIIGCVQPQKMFTQSLAVRRERRLIFFVFDRMRCRKIFYHRLYNGHIVFEINFSTIIVEITWN